MKTKKRTKSSRMHGKNMGTHGHGARKKRKGSGHRGGVGMSGSGKRADHKKTLITKKHGNEYFGRRGITSRRTQKDKRKKINLKDIDNKIRKIGKEKSGKWEIDLKGYKILGTGEIKDKIIVKAESVSKKAKEKIIAAGGEIILSGKNNLKKEEK